MTSTRPKLHEDSPLELSLAFQLKAAGLPVPKREFQFCKRKWRADFAWPDQRLIVELEGGVFSRGWHQSISGYLDDVDKHNAIILLGWRLLRFTRKHVDSGQALGMIEEALDLSPIGYCKKCDSRIRVPYSQHFRERNMGAS